MEAILEKLGWKKFAAIVVVVMIVFIILVVSTFRESDKKSISDDNLEMGRGSQSNVNFDENNEGNNNTFKYETGYYSILYPIRFSIATFIANPPVLDNLVLSDDITSNKIQIVVFSGQGNTVNSLSLPYQNKNFEGRGIEQNGNYGFLYEGGIRSDHHQKVALIQKGNFIIRFNLSYAGERNLDVERAFDHILESLD